MLSRVAARAKRWAASYYWRFYRKVRLGRRRNQALILLFRLQRKRVVHILHIGKTGGTALRGLVEGNEHRGKVGLICWWHDTRLRDIPKGDGVIFFLRDPVSRYTSGFDARLREGKPRFYAPHEPEEAWAFERFKTPGELAEALSSTDAARRADAEQAMVSIWHVAHPQVDALDSLLYFRSRIDDVFHIGRQETFDLDVRQIAELAGMPTSVMGATLDPVKANRRPKAPMELSTTAIENLRHWYSDDYALLDECDAWRAERTELEDRRLQR